MITGGTDGIGKEVVGLLYSENPSTRFLVVGRNSEKFARLQSVYRGAKLEFLQYDLSLMREGVQACIDYVWRSVSHLDIVVHCAGIMLRRRTITREGLETVFALQYLARQKLSLELINLLEKSPNRTGRMVNVSAGGMFNLKIPYDNLMGEKFYNGSLALIRESVANDMLTLELAERFPGIRHYCYGPFLVKTTLLRDMDPATKILAQLGNPCFGITPLRAAEDVLGLLDVSRSVASGLYGRNFRKAKVSSYKADPKNRGLLLDHCDKLIQSCVLVVERTPVDKGS